MWKHPKKFSLKTTQFQIFIQCCIICFFNSCTAIFYNSLAFITPSPAILVFGQLCWSINHGCPALIYVTMNETIRREFKKLIFRVATSKVEEGTSSANVKTITQSRIWIYLYWLFTFFKINITAQSQRTENKKEYHVYGETETVKIWKKNTFFLIYTNCNC